jgi:uncharacterized LabA/DUF88 family protein
MSFGKATSQKLIEACDDFMDLDENPRKYLIGYGNRRTHRKMPIPTEN